MTPKISTRAKHRTGETVLNYGKDMSTPKFSESSDSVVPEKIMAMAKVFKLLSDLLQIADRGSHYGKASQRAAILSLRKLAIYHPVLVCEQVHWKSQNLEIADFVQTHIDQINSSKST